MTEVTMAGVSAQTVSTGRITTRVLFSGPEDGVPVLFLHGNVSTATWWEDLMLSLPDAFRAIAPDQRGFGGADPEEKIDATRGMGDMADDAAALLDHLGIDQAHIVGISMGGNVVWRLLRDYPSRFLSATQIAPGSPYGFGGTKDKEGTPCYDDFAGSGAGLINPEVVRLIAAGDRSLDSPFSPRAALRNLVYKPPLVPEREEAHLSALLATHIGERDYPGDTVPSPNWPFAAPGIWGVNNALSPKYAGDMGTLYSATPKTDVLWIRGSHDLVVSDNAAADPGTLGAAGLIPNYPGPDVYPSQPMLAQTRAVLEEYARAGGSFREMVIPDCAHAPYIDDLEAFNELFHGHLLGNT